MQNLWCSWYPLVGGLSGYRWPSVSSLSAHCDWSLAFPPHLSDNSWLTIIVTGSQLLSDKCYCGERKRGFFIFLQNLQNIGLITGNTTLWDGKTNIFLCQLKTLLAWQRSRDSGQLKKNTEWQDLLNKNSASHDAFFEGAVPIPGNRLQNKFNCHSMNVDDVRFQHWNKIPIQQFDWMVIWVSTKTYT